MRKTIERFILLTACCSLLAMLPAFSAHAQGTDLSFLSIGGAPYVNVDIPSHFTPPVSAPPRATISLAPLDVSRPRFGSCGGAGGNCLELPSVIFENKPGQPGCGLACQP